MEMSMDRSELRQKALSTLALFIPDPSVLEDLTEERPFKEVDIDSMYMVDFSLELEGLFDIRFTDEEVASMKSLKVVLDLLTAKLDAKA
jgi:acyl carrier protein